MRIKQKLAGQLGSFYCDQIGQFYNCSSITDCSFTRSIMYHNHTPGNLYNSHYSSYQNNQSSNQDNYGNINYNYGDVYTYSHDDKSFKNVSTNYDHFGYVADVQANSNQYTGPGYSQPMAFISTDYNGSNYKQVNSIPNLHNSMWTGYPNVVDEPTAQAVGEEQNDEDGMMMMMMNQVVEMVASQPGLETMINSAEFLTATLEDVEVVEVPVAEAVDTHPGLEPTAKLKIKNGRVSRKTRRQIQHGGPVKLKNSIYARFANEEKVGREALKVIYGDSVKKYREFITKHLNEEQRKAAMDLRVKFRHRKATKRLREKQREEIALLEEQLKEKMKINEKLREEGRDLESRRDESKAKLDILKDLLMI